MRGLLLDEEGFSKEKQVVIEERKMRTEDSPEGQLYERDAADKERARKYWGQGEFL